MKGYRFQDTQLYKGEYESFIIKAEDEEEAWALLPQRHSDMGKGGIRPEDAKERYKLL